MENRHRIVADRSRPTRHHAAALESGAAVPGCRGFIPGIAQQVREAFVGPLATGVLPQCTFKMAACLQPQRGCLGSHAGVFGAQVKRLDLRQQHFAQIDPADGVRGMEHHCPFERAPGRPTVTAEEHRATQRIERCAIAQVYVLLFKTVDESSLDLGGRGLDLTYFGSCDCLTQAGGKRRG